MNIETVRQLLTEHQATSKALTPTDLRMACSCGAIADAEPVLYGNAWIINHQAEIIAGAAK